jgi:hypothetical protein
MQLSDPPVVPELELQDETKPPMFRPTLEAGKIRLEENAL